MKKSITKSILFFTILLALAFSRAGRHSGLRRHTNRDQYQ